MSGKRHKLWLPLSLAGLAMIALGVARGEVGIVLSKAIRVCLECIGIG
jgi:hypothetical protein